MENIYKLNKSKKVGEECKCPSCGTLFVKSHYQQAFCKSKKGTICKDKYWNTVTPEKRNNTTRISPANAAWQSKNYYTHSNILGYTQAELDKLDKEYNELNFEGGVDNVIMERCEYCECIICRCEN